uniref:Gustatory receptor n=1 Tax=Plectus sambesii TaxID=2011161 RepID=A0A914W0A5_9BILA
MESPQIGLPVIIFVVVCHYMACAFQQHRHHLINCTILGRNFLETSWRDYVEMVHVVKRLNSLTAFFIFMNACCAVIVSCLGFFYLIHGQALHVTNSTVDTDLLLNDLSFWILRKNVLLMVFCFVGYCLGAIHLNEQIHKIRHCVLELESGEDIEPYVYRFISMANDRTNGLTMGTFFVMERGSLFTTMSLIFSLVLMWLRFSLTEEREQWSWYKNQSLVINCDDYLEAQI